MTNLAVIFKALGDKTRLDIVRLLRGKELCVCDIIDAFSHSQPAISHHLKILKHAGIVNDNRDGKWIFYTTNETVFKEIEIFILEQLEADITKRRCNPSSISAL